MIGRAIFVLDRLLTSEVGEFKSLFLLRNKHKSRDASILLLVCSRLSAGCLQEDNMFQFNNMKTISLRRVAAKRQRSEDDEEVGYNIATGT